MIAASAFVYIQRLRVNEKDKDKDEAGALSIPGGEGHHPLPALARVRW